MTEKRVIKRNILFWGKAALQLTAIMTLFMVIYGFFFNIGEVDMLKDFWSTAYFYGVLISILFAMIGPMSYGVSYLPMVLSFGSKRKEAVFGIQIYSVVYVVSAYVITFICGYISRGTTNGMINLLILELFIVMIAIGQLGCTAQMRFGIKGIIMTIIIVVIAMVAGIIAGIGYFDNIAAYFEGMHTAILWRLLGAGAVVSVLLYIVSVAVFLRVIKTYEVK